MRVPEEFEALLTPRGRQVLDGKWHPGALAVAGGRFIALPGLIDPRQARRVLRALEGAFPPSSLEPLEQPIPPEATWAMSENYSELLPKTGRVRTAMLESKRARTYQLAQELGLVALLTSQSFRAFAQNLNGRKLREHNGIQLLCYGAGDYAGPHNDHHPEDEEAQDGYLDVHLTFCNAAVKRQLLVYERRGHFSEVREVSGLGLITAYRLPFWHFTTPLEGDDSARRWVLLGTFLDRIVSP